MSEHKVSVSWKRDTPDFQFESYDRTHTWTFEGGATVTASAAADFGGKPGLVDPEAAYAGSLSSCHMLTFLAIAAKKRLTLDSYRDDAVAILEKNEKGKLAVTRVILRPRVVFSGERIPDAGEIEKIHETARDHCFIANSVLTEIVLET